jgi:hypothetical protein
MVTGLARFPNDPEAWVSDLSDVRLVVEARGRNCEGAVDVTSFEQGTRPPDEPYRVAADIVEQRVADVLEPYDPADRGGHLAADAREQAESVLSGRVDLAPEPKVADYEDPFALEGMEEG